MAQYLPQRFSGLLLRILEPFKAHCQLYENGKITVNGAKSIHDARKLARRFGRMLTRIGYAITLTDFKVVNIVGNVHLNRSVNLQSIPLSRTVMYAPELFPGMRIRFPELNTSAVLFHSGKANLLGARTLLDLQAAALELDLIVP